jgi:selenide, water dikinase
VGGGHSHLTVIKQLGMRPLPGLRITVISRDIHTPYSGMMPGLIAGHYQYDDAHIDLRPLCQFADVRLFHSQVTNINVEQRQIYCDNRPPVRYDWLSINTGSQPALAGIPGASQVGIAVKPIDHFLRHWQQVVDSQKRSPHSRKVAVVGGGAASVEVLLAAQYHLKQSHLKQYRLKQSQLKQHQSQQREPQQALDTQTEQLSFELLCATPTILAHHNRQVQQQMTQTLTRRGVKIRTNCTVKTAQRYPDNAQPLSLLLSDGQQLDYNEVIWAVHAGSPSWVKQTGLNCDDAGFIEVNASLQSTSHANVFAAGDVAHFAAQPLAKSGVYAVRAGKILADNLRRVVQGKPLIPYRPQQRFLSLMITGDKYAIASKGRWSAKGRWLWTLKNHIDKKFMRQFTQLAPMASAQESLPRLKTADSVEPAKDDNTQSPLMRCGGCGAKVSHQVLSRVMSQLKPIKHNNVSVGLDSPDDAAVINPPAGKPWIQTVDYFRAFIDDPYLLGQIATNHCLSDIYAMGATPHSALAIATIPFGSEAVVEDTLLQLMQGAVESLNQQNTALIGGHSSEGSELGFGLSVNGVMESERLLTKGALNTGQVLILSKPLGTGTLLAANMLGKAKGRWIDQALQQMLISNQHAAKIIYQHHATACTDITGFGLIGHLLEMLRASGLGAHIRLHELPVLEGAVDCAGQGWLSSLHADNRKAEQAIVNQLTVNTDPLYPLLFDPQTAGGLLAAVPFDQAPQCLNMLRQHDCPQAAIIGEIDSSLPTAGISLITST